MKDIARHDKDTGSSEVQIAQLTDKIENLSKHIKQYKKDKDWDYFVHDMRCWLISLCKNTNFLN